MERLNNPFVIYGYKGADYFCDRQKETESITRALHNERTLLLYPLDVLARRGLFIMPLPK